MIQRVFQMVLCCAVLVALTLAPGYLEAGTISVDLGGTDYLCQNISFPSNCSNDPTFLCIKGDFIGQDVIGSGLSSVRQIYLSLLYRDLEPGYHSDVRRPD